MGHEGPKVLTRDSCESPETNSTHSVESLLVSEERTGNIATKRRLLKKAWAEPKGGAKQRGGGSKPRKDGPSETISKPRKDGPSETIFGDAPKTVFEGVA